MDRRSVLAGAGAVGGCWLAGCLTRDGDDSPEPEEEDESDEGELRVVAEESFVRPEDSPAQWLEAAFREEHEDVEIVWVSPEAGVDLFVRQARQGVTIDEDVYLGCTPTDLLRADAGAVGDGESEAGASEDDGGNDSGAGDANDTASTDGSTSDDEAGDGEAGGDDGVGSEADADDGDGYEVFRPLDDGRLSRANRIRDEFASAFDDPDGRALPVTVDFGCLLYDGTVTEAPESLDELLQGAYEDDLVAQNPRTDETGRSFAYWTVDEYGPAGSLEYWSGLRDNGVRLYEDWESSYEAYLGDDEALLFGRASERVPTTRAQDVLNPTRHQVAYPGDAGYLLPHGAAIFADTTRPLLAHQFVDFLLSSPVQTELAARTGRFPVVDEDLDLPDRFHEYALEPSTPVSLSREELRDVHAGWFDDLDDVFDDGGS